MNRRLRHRSPQRRKRQSRHLPKRLLPRLQRRSQVRRSRRPQRLRSRVPSAPQRRVRSRASTHRIRAVSAAMRRPHVHMHRASREHMQASVRASRRQPRTHLTVPVPQRARSRASTHHVRATTRSAASRACTRLRRATFRARTQWHARRPTTTNAVAVAQASAVDSVVAQVRVATAHRSQVHGVSIAKAQVRAAIVLAATASVVAITADSRTTGLAMGHHVAAAAVAEALQAHSDVRAASRRRLVRTGSRSVMNTRR